MSSSGSDETADGSSDDVVDDPHTGDDPKGTEADQLPVNIGRDFAERLRRENPAELERLAKMIKQSSALRDAYAFLDTDRGQMARSIKNLGEMMTAGTEAQARGARMAAQVVRMAELSPAFDHSAVSSILTSYSGLANTVLQDYSFEPLTAAMRAAAANSTASWLKNSFDTSAVTASLRTMLDARERTLGDWAGVSVLLDGLAQATSGIARELQRRFPGFLPENWVELDEDTVAKLEAIVRNEGIPLAWVPRPEILKVLAGADDREARVALLLEHQDLIIDDCVTSLGELGGDFAHFGTLAIGAVDAYRAGARGAALSHAVNILDSAVQRTLGKPRNGHRKLLDFPMERIPTHSLRCFLALFPLFTFYSSWTPGFGQARPPTLSRNIVAHGLTGQEPDDEPLVALMYVASALRGLEDWEKYDVRSISMKLRRHKES